MSNIELSDSIKFISIQQCEQHRECWSEVTCGLWTCLMTDGGPGSIVRIATGYGLDGPGIESQWGARLFRTCPDQPWGPPSLLYNGYRVFPGRKERPAHDADPSPPSSAVVMKE